MRPSPHILIVDDDQEICDLLSKFLGAQGFRVSAVADGSEMRHAMARGDVDLVVLDLMLPGEDGLSLCRHIRATSDMPIIMLTAMGSETDRVVGLEMGADDYLAKPFSSRELLARIKAVLRRLGGREPPGAIASDQPTSPRERPHNETFTFAGWALDAGRRRLRSPDGVLVELTGAEFDLLLTFVLNPQRVLDRDELLSLVRGRVAGPEDRTIDVQVGRLRRKMEADPKNPDLIKTVRGGGYVLAAEARRQG